MKRKARVLLVAGARPNFVKAAALWRALRAERIPTDLCHTGQHYDWAMSGSFFRELGLPRPRYFLGVGSGSHAEQTSRTMIAVEGVLRRARPELLVVVGDVNSTMAAALAAVKLGVLVAHVEAGLRSFDRSMPEEINRLVADAVADWFFVTEPAGVKNLLREGARRERILLCGNVMTDPLLAMRPRAARLAMDRKLGLPRKGFALATLHRAANVDDGHVLARLVSALDKLGRELPVALACHPRTLKNLRKFGLLGRFGRLPISGDIIPISRKKIGIMSPDLRRKKIGIMSPDLRGLFLLPAQGYLEFLSLTLSARLVLTDSGGLQGEAAVLGVPCLVLRNETEQPITVERGGNVLVGTSPARILAAARRVLAGRPKARRIPLWDGRAGRRVAEAIAGILRRGRSTCAI